MVTPDQVALIEQRAQRQVSYNRASMHITASEVADLTGAYQDLRRRLAEIAALVPPALVDWVCNYRPELHEKLEEIGEIAKLGP